jgi:hypothetical protein
MGFFYTRKGCRVIGRGAAMNRFYIFVFRLILGAGFAVLLSRFFFPNASIPWVIGVGVCLVGLAYVTEYFRVRKQMEDNKGNDR